MIYVGPIYRGTQCRPVVETEGNLPSDVAGIDKFLIFNAIRFQDF